MLVSKIKPCMFTIKSLHDESANGSLKQFYSTPWSQVIWITVVILELIDAQNRDFLEAVYLLDTEPIGQPLLDDS